MYSCPKILRSISNRSSHSDRELNVVTNQPSVCSLRRLTIPIYSNQQSLKKRFSLIINKSPLEMCSASDDHEMHEFLPHTTNEENMDTNQSSEMNMPDRTIINQQPLSSHINYPTTAPIRRHSLSMHRTLAQLKNKIKSCRSISHDDDGKNHGYLIVEDADSELVLLPDDGFDQQATRYAQQPCVHVNDKFDLSQIQYEAAMPVTPNLPSSTSAQSLLSLSSMIGETTNGLDLQTTQYAIQCDTPQTDLLNVNNVQLSETITTTSSSTNSSRHRYSDVNRSLLNDTEYLEAQQLDLESLTMLEIHLSEDRQRILKDLDDESDFIELYEQTLETNQALTQELQALRQEYDYIYSPWSCKFCMYDNEPYSITRLDIWFSCESPSPLKEARLMR